MTQKLAEKLTHMITNALDCYLLKIVTKQTLRVYVADANLSMNAAFRKARFDKEL